MIKHKIGKKNNGVEWVNLTPMRAIRKKCLECCCWLAQEIKLCELTLCPLWPFRTGNRPKSNTENTDSSAETMG